MATFVGLHNRVYFGHLDLSGLSDRVTFGPLSVAMARCTTFNDGGYECYKPGLVSGEFSVSGLQDFAADTFDDEISLTALGTQYAVTVVPNPTGTVTVADPCWFARGPLSGWSSPWTVGEMARTELAAMYDTPPILGKVAHVLGARTSDGNGTAVALTGPTSSQKLYAALHVTAYSGFTNVVFKVQTDDNSSFTSATDRITFTTVTGTTNEFASVAGDFSTETHARVTWDVTGSGSVSFVAAFGVA